MPKTKKQSKQAPETPPSQGERGDFAEQNTTDLDAGTTA